MMALVPLSPLLRRPPPLRVSLQNPSPLPLDPHENESSSSSSNHPSTKKQKNKSIWINPESPRGPSLLLNSARLSLLSSSLDLSPSSDNIPLLLSSSLPSPPPLPSAITILNSIHNPSSALPTLHWFLQNLPSPSPSLILFNLTLKLLLRNSPSSSTHDQIDSLLTHMLRANIPPDHITLSTLLTFRNTKSLLLPWLHIFQQRFAPHHLSYSALIRAYARLGDLQSALSLYDRARNDPTTCPRLHPLAFAALIRAYAASGNFDGALNLFQEMKALRVKPNLLAYNNLLDAMVRARRPWQVKNIYNHMLLATALVPNRITFSKLIRAYSQARYAADALAVYREMRRRSMDLNVVLCNMLLSMCADVGCVDEAVEIFGEMKDPDSWSYSSLITAYSCAGNVAEAERVMGAMMEAGFQPTIFVFTSIVQCYGNAGRIDDVVRTFDRMLELGISPDQRFCGCLLNVMTRAAAGDECLWKVIECVERSDPRLGDFVKLMVVDEGTTTSEEMLKRGAEQLFGSVGEEVRKAYCNCLIDLCVNMNLPGRASVLLNLALEVGVYSALQSKSVTQWSLHVRSLSIGAALTALRGWMSDMTEAMENGEELPPLLGIQTGHGKHKYSERGLASAFVPHLREMNAPFHEATDKVGWFLTTNIAAKLWLQSRAPAELVVA